MAFGHRKGDPSRAQLIEAGESPGFVGSAEQRTSQATQAMAEQMNTLIGEQRRTNALLSELVGLLQQAPAPAPGYGPRHGG